MTKLQDYLKDLKKSKRAVLAVNFYNFETLSAVLHAARTSGTPIILQATRSTIKYLGLKVATQMARAAIEEYGVKAWMHLDHAQDIDLIKRALDAGFDSVMIDASEEPFDKNKEITRTVVELAKPYHANVEAELGYIAKLGQSKSTLSFTQPEEADEFVRETGIDALAVAIGSSHGFYDKEPNLDIELLKRINAKTSAALVLHGGSGIPDNQLQQAVRHGICKINLATEVKDGFINKLRTELPKSKEIDLRELFPVAISHVQKLVEEKIRVINQE